MKKLIFFILLASGCTWGQSFYQFPSPLPNARFYVCGVPAVGNPCTNTASIFADQAQTIPITLPAQIGPTGQFSFWVAPGQYYIQVQAPFNLTYVISLGGGGGGGAVSSWNGRTGAVVPATNDYNFNQLAGSLALSQFPNGVVTNGATTVGTLPVFVTNAQTLGNSLWTDNGTSSLYSGATVGVGTGDPSCGSATGALCMTEGSTEGTPTAGHDYLRADTVLYGHALVASVNADGPFLMVRSRNSGAIGQALLSNADGTASFADPNISINTVSLFSAQAATGTATSPATTNPLRSGYGTLSISGTGITGTPSGCSIALFYNMANGGAQDVNAFATIFFTPQNPKQNFTVAPLATVGSQGDNIVAVYACGTYPSAGTLTVSFNPAMPVAPSGSSLPMNIQQVGGQQLSQNLAISHDPSQTSTCSANSNSATNTLTISGLVINAGDTVMVGTTGSNAAGTMTSITDSGGSTYTQITAKSATSAARVFIWGTAAGAALASTSLTVTLGQNQKFVACVSTYVGVQSFGSTATNSATSATPTVTVTTQDPGNFVFAVLGEGTTNVMTASSGTLLATTQTTATTPASGAICDNTSGQPSAITCAVSATSAAWASAGVELRSSASTGASLPVQIVATQPQLNTPLNVATQLVGSSGNISPIACDKTAISQALATSGSTQIVAASGTKNIYVCGWTVNSASTTAVTAKLVVGTGSNCATTPQDLSGQVTLQALSANSPVGQSITPPSDTVWNNNSIATPVANPALCVNLSSANSVNVQVWYAQF